MERYTYFDGGKWRLKIGDTEYKSERWTSPLIDICGTPYNTEQAVERMHVVSREAAEAALKEREAIQNVLDKQDKG